MVGHSPHREHCLPLVASVLSLLGALVRGIHHEESLAFNFWILTSGKRKIRNSAKLCQRSSLFIYSKPTSRTFWGLENTERMPSRRSVKVANLPLWRKIKKLINLPSFKSPTTRFMHCLAFLKDAT